MRTKTFTSLCKTKGRKRIIMLPLVQPGHLPMWHTCLLSVVFFMSSLAFAAEGKNTMPGSVCNSVCICLKGCLEGNDSS